LEKRLEDICLEALGELPTGELFPEMPNSKFRIPVSSLAGKDRSKVKKKWDKYLSSISTKRRIVRLEDLEEPYPFTKVVFSKRLDVSGFATVGDPFTDYAVLDIPKDVALKIAILGFAPIA